MRLKVKSLQILTGSIRLGRIAVLCALAIACILSARAANYTFHHPEKAHSLFGVCVNTLFEDNKGYLWVGTDNGLFRYDGYDLDRLGSSSPAQFDSERHVADLQEDANQHLWIHLSGTTEYALLDSTRKSVDPLTYLHTHGLSTSRTCKVQVDESGNLWCVTSDSVYYCDLKHGQFREYDIPGTITANLQRVNVRTFNEYLYILDGNELMTFNRSLNVWTQEQIDISLPDLGNVSESLSLTECYVDNKGGIWLSSFFSEAIYYRSPSSLQWHRVSLPAENYVVQNCIRKICEDSNRGIWIATNHRGLFLYHPETKSFEHFEHGIGDASTITSNNVNTLLVDRHNTLWVGYYKTGLSFCQPNLDLLHNRASECTDVSALLATDNGDRWIGTDGRGLWHEREDGRVEQVTKIPNITISDLKLDSDGTLWIGAYDRGLYSLDSQGNIRHYDAASGVLPHDGVHRMTIDSKDRLWVCSAFGPFYCFVPKNQTYTIIRGEDNSELPGLSVAYDAANNRILLATYYGIWVQDLESNKGYRMLSARRGRQPLPSLQISNLLFDDLLPFLWMSHHEGITVWDMRSDSLYTISSAEGFSSDVQALCQDLQHNIWASTIQGISMIRASRHVNGEWAFSVHNFLSSISTPQAPMFSPYAADVAPNGMMLFGGSEGYTEFDCSRLLNRPNGQLVVNIASVAVRDSLVDFSSSLSLGYNEYPVSLSFFTGNPLDANDVSFSYRVVGLQDNWVDTRTNKITFLSLAPGTYNFEVKGIGLDGEWSPVVSLQILVSPPWWKSWPMYFIYLLIVGLLLFAYQKSMAVRQRRKAIEEKRELLHEQQNQLFETKMQFFTNISHEIRTPLSLIVTPLEVLLREPLPDPVHRRLLMIWRNSRILYNEVSNLLDFNKMGNSEEHLNRCRPRDIVAFVKEYVSQYEEILRDKKIAYQYHLPSQTIITTFDEDKLRKILYNLYSNAMKYTPQGSQLVFTLSDLLQGVPQRSDSGEDVAQYIEFRLSDEGPGVSDNEKRRIFERFYQTKGADAKPGTGIGLHLVQSFVKLHGGNIWVEDNHPKGSIFCFTLPIVASDSLPIVDNSQAEMTQSPSDQISSSSLSDVLPGPVLQSENPVSDSEKSSILVVDDNTDLCQFITDSLSPYHHVYMAHNGLEAMQILEQNEDICLVVSDVMMPVMDGLELCNSIKSDIRFSHIPVILLTARTADQNVMEGLQQGADDYITKPFSIERLRLRISKFLQWSQRSHVEFLAQPNIEPREITITPLDEKFLQSALDVVNDHLQDVDFGVEAMAAAVNMSRSQLYKKLMAVTGKSPLDFIRTMRMKRAKELLSKSQLQVSEIAYQVGYNTLKTFTENFKSEFGVTPTEWLKHPRSDS